MKLKRSNDLLYDIDSRGVATLTLNRTEKYNAFDSELIHQLISTIDHLAQNPEIRCLLLRSNGEHFSAGADLNWMKEMAQQDHTANIKDAQQLAKLMSNLDTFPHPTITYVHGSAFGGALGLICCSDIAIADQHARFCLSEVKLGLVPATIAPYVIRAIGTRQARRYMLTAEFIDATKALELNIIHHLTSAEKVEQYLSHVVDHTLRNSPNAISQAKELINHCDNQIIDSDLIDYTSKMIADVRASKHGQEGLSAFIEKRAPNWPQEE